MHVHMLHVFYECMYVCTYDTVMCSYVYMGDKSCTRICVCMIGYALVGMFAMYVYIVVFCLDGTICG